jgi:hypothetical protein
MTSRRILLVEDNRTTPNWCCGRFAATPITGRAIVQDGLAAVETLFDRTASHRPGRRSSARLAPA